MGSRTVITTTFEIDKVIQPLYNGGDVALDSEGRILVTCLGEEAIVSDFRSGDVLARIEGDGEALTALLTTPSASHVITCSRSLSMRIYTLEATEEPPGLKTSISRTVKPHTTPVVSAAVDRWGSLLATGSADGAVKVWDIEGGYVTHSLRGHSGLVSSLKFFEMGAQASSGHGNFPPSRESKAINGNDHGELGTKSRNGSHIAKNGSSSLFCLASGGEDGKIRVWNLETRKAIAKLDSHFSVVRSLDCYPERGLLISGSRDNTAILWDMSSWKAKRTFPVLESVEAVGFLTGGKFIFTGGDRGVVRIWQTETGRETTRPQQGLEENRITQILSHATWRFLMAVHEDQSLVLQTVELLAQLEDSAEIDTLPTLKRLPGTHDEIIDLGYLSTAHGEFLALATNENYVKVVSTSTEPAIGVDGKSEMFGAEVGQLQGHEDIVICLAADVSGHWVATGAKDNTARLWKIDPSGNNFDCFAHFTGHAEAVGAVALASNSAERTSPGETNPPRVLITGSQDQTIKKWQIPATSSDRPRAAFTRKAHDKDINSVAICYNLKYFASASQDRTAKIWSFDDGEVLGVLRGHKRGVWSVAFAPEEMGLLSTSHGVQHPKTGLVVTGSADKSVKLWSMKDYGCLSTFEGHSNSVLKVVWLPPPPPPVVKTKISAEDSSSKKGSDSGSRPLIASAGGDGLVKVWNVSTGECECTLDNHTDRVWALATAATGGTPPGSSSSSSSSSTSSGHRLISGGGDGVVTFWRDTTEATVAASAAASAARVEQDQLLSNHMQRGNYREAIVLALRLDHPGRLLALFTAVAKNQHANAAAAAAAAADEGNAASITGSKEVDDALAGLADDQLFALLQRVRDWNTNAKTAPVAQRILRLVALTFPPERLLGLQHQQRPQQQQQQQQQQGSLRKRRQMGDLLEGLRAYTERHYRRCEELIEESYLVDFVVRSMDERGFAVDQDVAQR